jgi:glycosyltransferase involved in cell wall biosynthesis
VIRALHISAGNLYGGVERLIGTLARNRELVRRMEPEFALCFNGQLAREIVLTGARLHMLGAVRASRPSTVFQARRRLEAVIRAGKFDVIVNHSVWPLAIFGPVLRRLSIPLVFWLHDSATGPRWLERWARRAQPDLVLCNSLYTAASAEAICPGVQSKILYYPIELVSANNAPMNRAEIRRELDTPSHSVVIIQVSRMEPWKGHYLHLEALQKLANEPDWICWIVGGPQRPRETQYFEDLKRLAVRYGVADRVRFLGFRSDIPQLLGAADIFCQPNAAPEPFGIVFIEALLAGLPVVTIDMGGAREIVNASCGMLVAPNDPSSLAKVLRRLVTDQPLRAHLGDSAPARARVLCGLRSNLEALTGILDDVVAQRIGNSQYVAGA